MAAHLLILTREIKSCARAQVMKYGGGCAEDLKDMSFAAILDRVLLLHSFHAQVPFRRNT